MPISVFSEGDSEGSFRISLEDSNVRRFVGVTATHDCAGLREVLGFLKADEPDRIVSAFDPPVWELVEHGQQPWELLNAIHR